MNEEWLVYEAALPDDGETFGDLREAEIAAKTRSLGGGIWFVHSKDIDDNYSIAYNGELYYK